MKKVNRKPITKLAPKKNKVLGKAKESTSRPGGLKAVNQELADRLEQCEKDLKASQDKAISLINDNKTKSFLCEALKKITKVLKELKKDKDHLQRTCDLLSKQRGEALDNLAMAEAYIQILPDEKKEDSEDEDGEEENNGSQSVVIKGTLSSVKEKELKKFLDKLIPKKEE